jgi:hypothetical protein
VETIIMKYVILFIPLFFAACNREERKPAEPSPLPLQAATAEAMQSVAGPMFAGLKEMLDLNHVQSVTREENVVIYMAPFKDDANKIYAASSRGEVLYVKRGDVIGLLKEGEAIRIEGREVRDITTGEFQAQFTQMTDEQIRQKVGFCQRQKNQTFGQCYKHESDEFCDSFISCLAINTQPTIHIVIAVACSCYSSEATTKYTAPTEKDDSLFKPDLPLNIEP